MHKSRKLPERPKPPSFKEIIEDVEGAPADDVVFSQYSSPNNGEKTMAMEESYLESSELNINENPQEEAYEQALEFINLQKKLQGAPKLLDEQFERLKELENEVSTSISQLKESSDALKDKT